jgi:predicted PurR-regulated permease PerM
MLHSRSKNKADIVEITISNRTVIRVLLLIIVWFLALAALHKATHALLLLATAFFLSLALNAPVHWLADHLPGKRRGDRTLATGLSFLVVLLLLIGFLASIVPPLVRQTNSFIQAAPHLVADVHNQNSSLGHFVQTHNLGGTVDKLSSQLSERLKNVTGSAVGTITGITSSIFSMLAIFVLTFMMLIEGPRWLSVAERLLPDGKQAHVKQLAHDMYLVIRGYVNGQILLATIAAVLVVVPLLVFNISYPIGLMVIVFICGLIPLVGHSIGAVIVTIVALFHSPVDALIILIYYILYMQIEAYVIQPKIQADTTNLSPLLVFASVIIGVSFGGLFGGLVAIPIAGCLRVLIVDYIGNRHLMKAAVAEEIPSPTPEAE